MSADVSTSDSSVNEFDITVRLLDETGHELANGKLCDAIIPGIPQPTNSNATVDTGQSAVAWVTLEVTGQSGTCT